MNTVSVIPSRHGVDGSPAPCDGRLSRPTASDREQWRNLRNSLRVVAVGWDDIGGCEEVPASEALRPHDSERRVRCRGVDTIASKLTATRGPRSESQAFAYEYACVDQEAIILYDPRRLADVPRQPPLNGQPPRTGLELYGDGRQPSIDAGLADAGARCADGPAS